MSKIYPLLRQTTHDEVVINDLNRLMAKPINKHCRSVSYISTNMAFEHKLGFQGNVEHLSLSKLETVLSSRTDLLEWFDSLICDLMEQNRDSLMVLKDKLISLVRDESVSFDVPSFFKVDYLDVYCQIYFDIDLDSFLEVINNSKLRLHLNSIEAERSNLIIEKLIYQLIGDLLIRKRETIIERTLRLFMYWINERQQEMCQIMQTSDRVEIGCMEMQKRLMLEHSFKTELLYQKYCQFINECCNTFIDQLIRQKTKLRLLMGKKNYSGFSGLLSLLKIKQSRFGWQQENKQIEKILITLREGLNNLQDRKCLICDELVRPKRYVSCRRCRQSVCLLCFRKLAKCPFCRTNI